MILPQRSVRLLLVAPLLLGLVAVGCTQDPTPSSSDSVAKISPDAPTVSVEMPAVRTTVYKVGADKEKTYGQNQLVGEAVVLGKPAKVEILGNVEYLNGTGPFYGFLTVSWKDGSSLGFNIQGSAELLESGSTALKADMRFIGGTGEYESASATGKFTGSRGAAVGTPITIKLTLDVKK